MTQEAGKAAVLVFAEKRESSFQDSKWCPRRPPQRLGGGRSGDWLHSPGCLGRHHLRPPRPLGLRPRRCHSVGDATTHRVSAQSNSKSPLHAAIAAAPFPYRPLTLFSLSCVRLWQVGRRVIAGAVLTLDPDGHAGGGGAVGPRSDHQTRGMRASDATLCSAHVVPRSQAYERSSPALLSAGPAFVLVLVAIGSLSG
jgi:hypothetical protein